jgi:hypothetical protein
MPVKCPLPLFYDIEDNLAVGARSDCIQNGADRIDGPALFADNASEIFLCHAQFEDRGVIAVNLPHLDGIGIISQLPGQQRDSTTILSR